jgi:hypothetical protein
MPAVICNNQEGKSAPDASVNGIPPENRGFTSIRSPGRHPICIEYWLHRQLQPNGDVLRKIHDGLILLVIPLSLTPARITSRSRGTTEITVPLKLQSTSTVNSVPSTKS